MNHRKMLYGYQYQMGELVINQQEASTVKRIVTSYLNDLSYQKIADSLNEKCIPFSEENSFWNKHKIKRLLENPRYTGADGYPPIIDNTLFQKVQEKIRGKSGNCEKTSSIFRFKDLLMCDRCGTGLLTDIDRDRIHLRCKICASQMEILDEEFMNQITAQINPERNRPTQDAYQPSEDVMRLTNAVNRALEHSDDPDHIISLILQGVSARYDCCPNPAPPDKGAGLDEQQLRHLISYITVSQDNTITVHLQSP